MYLLSTLTLQSLLACSGGNCGDLEVASNATMNLALDFSWSSSEDATASIEWGLTEALGESLEPSQTGGEEHFAQLFPAPALSTVFYRITSTLASGKEEVCEGEVLTYGAPSGLPNLEVSRIDESAISAAPYIMGSVLGNPAAFLALDRATGELLWYRELAGPPFINPDVVFAQGSTDILYNQFHDNHGIDIGTVVREDLTGNLIEEYRTVNGHHAFTEREDGTIAYMAIDVREVTDSESGETVSVVGDAIFELDPSTGESREVITAWDAIPFLGGDLLEGSFYPQGQDWTHGNALVYDAVNPLTQGPTYTFSFGGLDIILLVDADSGEVIYEFSGEGGYGSESAWTVADGSIPFSFQHDTNWTPEGNLIMVTSNYQGNGLETAAIEYELDMESQTLREVWSYGFGEGLQAFALGQARRLENGNTFVSWGSGGIIREITPEGGIAWELQASTGSFFGQMSLLNELQGPVY